MNATVILFVIAAYFSVLLLISHLTGRKHSENDAFFLGNRTSPWLPVAFGMIGASLSGVTFVSVPGMVRDADMTYMQMALGFLPGYAVIAFILLPLYYRMNLTSIYTYLERRIGRRAYKTGAAFFLLARTVGAATRLYVAILILQTYVFDRWHIPFGLTACIFLGMIWLYTYRSGVRTIVWTDTLQTLCLLTALVLIAVQLADRMQLDAEGLVAAVRESPHFRIFVFDDWASRQHFVKQFLSGMFVTIAMTGVDQEMMQKNLSCRNLREARKNMCWYGISFVPVNFLFLCLGVLMLSFAAGAGIALPDAPDDMLPTLIAGGFLGDVSLIFFIIGIIAVTFSSADSALTGLTTSFCVDMLGIAKYPEAKARQMRIGVHLLISLAFIAIILILRAAAGSSIIDTFYTIVSYTYGPLLGLFAFGLISKRNTRDRWTPFVCIAAPLLCWALDRTLQHAFGYAFGYEILIVNAGLVMAGLFACSHRISGSGQKRF
ncbi:MAG: sodium:solute symporter [Tannerella sp.]|jgi:Na+/proline symporter|nr:sodium:solute symporter [Tannerella sp.]